MKPVQSNFSGQIASVDMERLQARRLASCAERQAERKPIPIANIRVPETIEMIWLAAVSRRQTIAGWRALLLEDRSLASFFLTLVAQSC